MLTTILFTVENVQNCQVSPTLSSGMQFYAPWPFLFSGMRLRFSCSLGSVHYNSSEYPVNFDKFFRADFYRVSLANYFQQFLVFTQNFSPHVVTIPQNVCSKSAINTLEKRTCSISIHLENAEKPEVFWRFKGGYRNWTRPLCECLHCWMKRGICAQGKTLNLTLKGILVTLELKVIYEDHTCPISIKLGDKPPCTQNIADSTIAAKVRIK